MTSTTSNHPASLKIFFTTEMWERYGFYVVQTLLALYLAMHLEWDDKHIYPLVGSFTALTYLSPVVGGWIADHLLGQKLTIMMGLFILFISYIALGFIASTLSLSFSLAGIAVGTGLLKPNISALLGNEYPPNSASRERGFTIFYMGITTGIILGTTLPSYIQSFFGWHVAFFSSSLGMVIAGLLFTFGIRYYHIRDYTPFEPHFKNLLIAFLLIFFLWLGSFYILHTPALANIVFISIALFSLAYLLLTIKQESEMQSKQTWVIGLLCLISVMFWAFYFQMFLSLTLFLKRVVQHEFLGIPFPPPYYVAIQSFGMIILGFFMARGQEQLSLRQRGMRVGDKFLLAMVFMTLAYTLITIVCFTIDTSLGLLSPLYIIPAYLLISVAELLLSPVGLSAITILSSNKKVSTMMGIFFVSLGVGGFLSGKLAILTAISQEQLNQMTPDELKIHYAVTFSHLLLILVSATAFCFILNRIIKYLMRPSLKAH